MSTLDELMSFNRVCGLRDKVSPKIIFVCLELLSACAGLWSEVNEEFLLVLLDEFMLTILKCNMKASDRAIHAMHAMHAVYM